MELVDRYLQAVRFWLPREQQDDVARELSDDILSQIEEEERALGRLMTPAEVETLLKSRGRPFVVANRYLPQRHLIGPLLFPVYALVLKIIGLAYVLPWIVIWGFLLAFAPGYRGHVARDLGSLWIMLVQIFATVTIIFAVQEHYFGATNALERWDPRRLPAVRERDRNRIPRASSIVELVVNLFFLAWWAGNFPIAYTVGQGWSGGTIWPEFHRTFFVPILLLVLTAIVVAAVNVVRPYWTRTRHVIRAITNAATAAIAGSTAAAHQETLRTSLRAHPTIGAIVDLAVVIGLTVATIICAITALVELYRAAAASSTYGTTSKLTS